MTNLIIDGSSLMHRTYWISKSRPLVTQDGKNVGDIFIFLRTLKAYINQYSPNKVYCCWDKKIEYPSVNFRAKLSESVYKDNRDKSLSDKVYSNSDIVLDMIDSLGIKNMYPRTLEADDVIAWLCHRLKGENIVMSADNDMLQLVSENTIVYNTMKKQVYNKENFQELIGMPVGAFVLYKAIMGDTSDNIKGVRGYGKVKAKKAALAAYDDGSFLYNHFNKEQKECIAKNIQLVNLSLGYKIEGEQEVKCYMKQLTDGCEPDLDKFKQYCEEFEFNGFLENFNEWENLFSHSTLLDILENIADNNK